MIHRWERYGRYLGIQIVYDRMLNGASPRSC